MSDPYVMVRMDAAAFLFAIRRLERSTGRTFCEIGSAYMAQAVKAGLDKTPPFGVTDKGRIIGERRVYKDIRSIIRAVPNDQMEQFDSKWIAWNDGQPIGHMFRRKDGSVYGVDYALLGTDMSILAKEHQSARSPVTGRTSKAGRYTRHIGRWKFVNRVHAPAAMRMEYIKKKQAHVGKTKSGWLAALSYFSKRGGVKFPPGIDWVQRHGSMHGQYIDAQNKQTGNGYLAALNNIPWAARFQPLVDFAIRTVDRYMGSGHFEARLQKTLKAAGF